MKMIQLKLLILAEIHLIHTLKLGEFLIIKKADCQ